MLLLAVVVQALAVVRGDGDDGTVVEAARAQPVQKPAHELVRVRHVAVVRRSRSAIALGGRVGRVGLVKMQEREEAPALPGLDETREGLHRGRAIPLEVAHRLGAGGGLERVVVGVEALGDAGGGAQHIRRDRPARAQARRFEAGGERLVLGGQAEAEVVPHAVARGQESGEQRGVGGQRHRAVGIDVLEHDPLASKPVQAGRASFAVAVERQVIGAQRVDRNQYDRGVSIGRDSAGRATGRGEEAERDRRRELSHARGILAWAAEVASIRSSPANSFGVRLQWQPRPALAPRSSAGLCFTKSPGCARALNIRCFPAGGQNGITT